MLGIGLFCLGMGMAFLGSEGAAGWAAGWGSMGACALLVAWEPRGRRPFAAVPAVFFGILFLRAIWMGEGPAALLVAGVPLGVIGVATALAARSVNRRWLSDPGPPP